MAAYLCREHLDRSCGWAGHGTYLT